MSVKNDPNSPSSKKMAVSIYREQETLKYRQTGATFYAIGKKLGITPQAAHKAMKRALAKANKLIAQDAEQLRTLELIRLDRLTLALWKSAAAGGLGAIDRLIKIMERRAKLLGLDVPTGIANINIDFNSLTNDQLERIANGENPLHVIRTNSGDGGVSKAAAEEYPDNGEDTHPQG